MNYSLYSYEMQNSELKLMPIKQIQITEIENAWGFKASPWFKKKFQEANLDYQDLTEAEYNSCITKVESSLDGSIEQAGKNRISKWELGWTENASEFIFNKTVSDLIPKYFGKIQIIRWNQKWIKPVNSSMEYTFFGLLLDWVFEKYITNVDSVYEFGCGTGHNLLRVRDLFPKVKLYGLDWTTASQKVIDLIVKETNDSNLFSKKFDYFNPDKNYNLNKNSIVLTIASLEQTGGNFKNFVDYLVSEKPSMVVHVEPIHEVLDENNILDDLSIKYFKKRNYLDGLVNYVRDLESKGIVKIHNLQRTYVGSFYIEGYSLLVWSTV